ncbi:exodeoxyribonuclease VII large subunit [Jeotgalibaca sp. MA1X17-3]|uniref:exodeoxyribonuclease VII large subunit n=1 Tax=Jeotgalibaca sp. MA1X17-3 TaxID=2908211 RepID=UPI001F2E0232|nr:exodeoxyribonuclease VII large subunit [Jeotgalibaca sp. MA1X17-3]UJF14671.1 exodeoxyribonuclease VII large subunit [Jeotgalibaca sp. MA1X17-3]
MSKQYLTVTALTKYIKRKFDADPYLERVYLTGEISNYKKRQNHQYFSIKDDHAVIQAVMYKREFSRLKFQLQEGMKILLVGRVNVYEASGNYNIIIEHMEPDGIGALYQAYTDLKDKLAKEGLFSAPKKPLPVFPKKIAIVTSPSGAVIRDIMTTIKRRYPIAQLVLFPTVVQGKDSAPDIIKNLKKINEANEYDVVIIGRGGGSIEDLWSFNEEKVVRQIFSMDVPIISSVGHETDTTLSDLVADVRAATPTAAAELSVPVLADVLQHIQNQKQRLYQVMRSMFAVRQEKLNRLMHSYVFRQPNRIYEAHMLKVDQSTTQLQNEMIKRVTEAQHRYQQTSLQLRNVNPITKIRLLEKELQDIDGDLHVTMKRYLLEKERDMVQLMQSLDFLSPLKIMTRGYSYVTLEDQVVNSIQQIKVGDYVNINLKDGNVRTEINKIEEKKHV